VSHEASDLTHQEAGPLTGPIDGLVGLRMLALERQGLDEDRGRAE
jgi:hypothetical protein